MQVTYTGKTDDLSREEREQLDARYAKLAKMLDGRGGEKEAHVILTQERHLHCAEIVVNYLDHGLVGHGSDPALFTALCNALDKMESQVVKLKEKRRDTKRKDRFKEAPDAAGSESADSDSVRADGGSRRVYRVNGHEGRKPMTIDEAVMEMEDGRSYVAFQDVESGGVAVLIRRADGHFDLVQP